MSIGCAIAHPMASVRSGITLAGMRFSQSVGCVVPAQPPPAIGSSCQRSTAPERCLAPGPRMLRRPSSNHRPARQIDACAMVLARRRRARWRAGIPEPRRPDGPRRCPHRSPSAGPAPAHRCCAGSTGESARPPAASLAHGAIQWSASAITTRGTHFPVHTSTRLAGHAAHPSRRCVPRHALGRFETGAPGTQWAVPCRHPGATGCDRCALWPPSGQAATDAVLLRPSCSRRCRP